MSSYRDRDDWGGGRLRSRSRSPERDRGYGGRDFRSDRGSSSGRGSSGRGSSGRGSSGRDSHDSRGSYDRGGRGGRGGRGPSGPSGPPKGPPKGPPLASVPVPQTGADPRYSELNPVGTQGLKTFVRANHFLVQSLPTVKIFIYDIRMTIPPECRIRGKESLTSSQIEKVMHHPDLRRLIGNSFVFDGVSKGFSPDKICDDDQVMSINLEVGHARRDGTENRILFEMRNKGIIDVHSFIRFLRELSTQTEIKIDPHELLLKWLNATLRTDPAERCITRPGSNSFFDRARSTVMTIASSGGLLEAIRGMFQSARIFGGKLTVNVDIATSVFWKPDICMIDHLCVLTRSSPQNLQATFIANPNAFFEAASRLLGMWVSVRHLGADRANLKMKFKAWSQKNALNTTFDHTDPLTGTTTTVSVNDYFNSRYGITLLFPELPMAETRRGDLPLEICYSSAGERYQELLQGPETADLITFASTPGHERKNSIYGALENLEWHTKPLLQAHGISMDYNMMRVKARVLEEPTVFYQNSSLKVNRGRWNLRNIRLHQPVTIRSWALLYLPSGRPLSQSEIERFASAFARGLSSIGISLPRNLPSLVMGHPNNVIGGLQDCISKAAGDFSVRPDIILVLIENASIPIHHDVKAAADIQLGVATAIMTMEKAFKEKGQAQYIANMGLKVNVKLGGINSIVREPLFKRRRYMIISADTSHPSPAELRREPPPQALSSLVASFDRDCVQYTAIAAAQAATNQMIVDIKPMVRELMRRYKVKNNGLLPQSVLFVRDGLGESQYKSIKDEEGRAVRAVCHEMAVEAKTSPPKITLVVAIKRHHTRFFPDEANMKDPRLCDRLGNVTPGTIVENGSGKDFFLVAHAGLIGTVRPCHYKVLVNEEAPTDFTIDDLQRIICYSCSTYARATTTVGVFSAIYYSDLVAERAKKHIRPSADGTRLILPPVHDNLTYTMYWQ